MLTRATPWLRRLWPALRIGLLVGLFEAVAVARWDVYPYRGGLAAIAWGAAVLAVEAGAWGLLALVTRGSRIVSSVLYVLAVLAARMWIGDRFHWVLFGLLVPVVLLARFAPPRLDGIVAIAIAMAPLAGRVPNYAVPPQAQVLFLLPGAILVVLLGLRPGVAAAFVAVVATLVAAGTRSPPRPARTGPNLVFVLVDTMRRDYVGPWSEHGPTPTALRLASEGVRFDEAVTVIPKTTASVAAMQTGLYPAHNGVRVLHDVLPARNRTLAEILRARGWATAAFVDNGSLTRGLGFEQGFDELWSCYELEQPYGPLRYGGALTALDGLSVRRIEKFDGNTDARVTTRRALDWLATAPRPFYAYVHYFDPHWPYRPPGMDARSMVNDIAKTRFSRGQMIFRNPLPPRENDKAKRLYGGEVVANVDAVTPLLRWLDREGLADDTLVVFTADHGHSLGEHQYWYHHGEFVYDPEVRIPLILRFPGRLPAGEVRGGQIRSIDLLPTLLGLLGVRSGETDGVDALRTTAAFSLLESDISRFRENDRRFVPGILGIVRAVRTPEWKLVYTPRPGQGVYELYDLTNDPAETRDLVAAGEAPADVAGDLLSKLRRSIRPAELRQLRAIGNRLDQLPAAATSRPRARGGAAQEQMSPIETEVLRSLGYVN